MSVLTGVGPDLLADGHADELARVVFLLPREPRRSRRRVQTLAQLGRPPLALPWSSKLAILQAG